VAPPPPDPPRWHRFVLPETIDAATFRVRSATIRISGVTALAADATCGAIEGTPFPCGRTGLFALRMFLQGRTVECYFPPVGDAARIIAPCRVGKTDLGLWLLSAGWAKPDANATEAYRAASAAARCAHRGLWRNEPPPPGCHAAARGGTP
jgi:endonuclease YncB( thermonuclease family)